ncbi:hypothetical protein IFM89_018367 [Coptis chinensis]|uniref:AIR12 DOMON domain-containing protein n=1 Tax=Coptis chinensis TaxID=261450 RepID=A0A835HN23_9MAGN|nr:hypothetical protein IFM89_018367 [Coptis chinensis]
MVGSQALVAFQAGGQMNAYTSPVTSYSTALAPGNLTFQVPSITAEFANNNEMTIFATLVLPPGNTTVNQVWQKGPVIGNTPQIHPTTGDNIRSIGTIDFLSGDRCVHIRPSSIISKITSCKVLAEYTGGSGGENLSKVCLTRGSRLYG